MYNVSMVDNKNTEATNMTRSFRTRQFNNTQQALAFIQDLSQSDRAAFVVVARVFSNVCDVFRFPIPSRIPDSFVDQVVGDSRTNAVAFRGQLQGFTRSTIIRDQNRSFGSR
jgi:hypothetical protein